MPVVPEKKKALVYFARNPASWVSGELPFIFEILA
jgi:hypothetical protein